MTTIGSTTWCSANLPIAAGSASRTLVSSTYVRRPGTAGAAAARNAGAWPGPAGSRAWLPVPSWLLVPLRLPVSVWLLVGRCARRAGVLATRSPLGAADGAAFGHACVGGTGTGQRWAGRRPFAHLACVPGREARRSRGPSRRAATHRPSVLTLPLPGHRPEVPQQPVNIPDPPIYLRGTDRCRAPAARPGALIR